MRKTKTKMSRFSNFFCQNVINKWLRSCLQRATRSLQIHRNPPRFSLLHKYWLLGRSSFLFHSKWKNLWKQSIIWHKKLSQTTTMSFLSEPVCLPPQLKHDFKGSESLLRISFSSGTQALRGQQWNGNKRIVCVLDGEKPTCVSLLYLLISDCLNVSVCLSYSLCLFFSQDSLTALISWKTDEYMQPLRNLMDLEWTWKIVKSRLFKYCSIKFNFMWVTFFWRQFYCPLIFARMTVEVIACWND